MYIKQEESVYCAFMATHMQLIIGGGANGLTISTFTKVSLLSYYMHRHYQYNYESIFGVLVYTYSNEVTHMIEKLFPIF